MNVLLKSFLKSFDVLVAIIKLPWTSLRDILRRDAGDDPRWLIYATALLQGAIVALVAARVIGWQGWGLSWWLWIVAAFVLYFVLMFYWMLDALADTE